MTEVYTTDTNDSAKPFEWAFRPMRQYDQFLDTFDFDQQVGDRKRIPKSFTNLKQFPDTTYRLSYADKAIRWYVKWPMWNAEYIKNKEHTWGMLTFIFGQFSIRYPNPGVILPPNLKFNLTYYLEFRKRKMPSNEAFSTGKYPGSM